MNSRIGSRLWVLMLTISALFVVGSFNVLAAESPGCQALGGSTGTTAEFYAGDRVRMTVQVFAAGPLTPQLYYDGISQVTGTPLSPGDTGKIAFTVPVTQIAQVQGVLLGDGNPGDYSILIECVTESAAQVSGGSSTLSLTAPDNRLNWRMGDEIAVMFPATTDEGVRRLDVYCYVNGQGLLAFAVTEDEIASASGSEPVLLASAADCRADLYWLPSEEIQLNIWTPEDKLYEIICADLQCADPTMRFTDPNE